uniref:D-serine ammonia-lyase n=1 Tax=Mesorhizobium sp. WSM4875 TaxID=3038539 RepID=UPI0024166CF5|nr:D-serine ammonia-lyase [Mesorhizobium sp. WSM4875]WIE94816.1 D-serine ammonia-lyase [Mesorhizobium sp. WSM4875]
MTFSLPDSPAKDDLLAGRPTLWLNTGPRCAGITDSSLPIRSTQVAEAETNWQRLAPLLQSIFPQLEALGGRIRSELIEADKLRHALGYSAPDYGRIFIKADGDLPVAGSIKARGGIYEVFMFAVRLGQESGLLDKDGDLLALASESARALFGQYAIAVGSTGNLGLSVGIAARSLGFKAVVHMSTDAKQWKVDRLIRMGAEVVRHKSDYTAAVDHARNNAAADPAIYFVDDERSELLFFGYSAAAQELAAQLTEAGVVVDAGRPLFVYLPCGIGGAPGGVAYGLKAIFGDAVHCFFVEPVQSPCAMVQMMSGSDELVSVYDVGLTNRTEADGMAVARMSSFVAKVMKPLLSGILTVEDDDLFCWLWQAHFCQGLQLEPSATASFAGPSFIVNSHQGQAYLTAHGLVDKSALAAHVLWTTGGAFVPQEQFDSFLKRGASLARVQA